MTTTADDSAQIPIRPTERALAWLNGRTFAELNAIEAQELCADCRGLKTIDGKPCEDCEGTGRTIARRKFFPGALKWRDTKGTIQEDRVLFVVPKPNDYLEAQEATIAWFAKRYHDDTLKTEDQVKTRIGAVLYVMKENAALVSLCARALEPPHIRAYTFRTVFDLERFDSHTIYLACEELKLLRELNEIPVASLTEVQCLRLAQEVARVGNASPLLGLDEGLRGPCMTTWARAYVASRTASSGSGSPAASTPET